MNQTCYCTGESCFLTFLHSVECQILKLLAPFFFLFFFFFFGGAQRLRKPKTEKGNTAFAQSRQRYSFVTWAQSTNWLTNYSCVFSRKFKSYMLACHASPAPAICDRPVWQGEDRTTNKLVTWHVLSRDFNMASPDDGDAPSITETPVTETENGQNSPVFSDGQVKCKYWSDSS